MTDPHTETGGLRWGRSYLRAAHASWPFARLRLDDSGIEVSVRFPLVGRRFTFDRSDITALRFRRLAGWGLQIEHGRDDRPAHISFWTTNRNRLSDALAALGYEVRQDEGA